MANTFTTNFNLTKPEIGGANDTWGTLVNSNLSDIDTQLYRKADKNDQKGATHTLSFDVNTKLVTTNVTRGFASFAVGDKITISHSGNAANKGEFKIEAITNDITIDLELLDDTEPTFVTESISSTVSIISEIDKVIGGIDASGGTLTTSTAQKDAIVDGSTAISRPLGIKSLAITTAGSGYSGSGNLTASTVGTSSGFTGTYTESGGAIATVTITNVGSGFTSAPTIALSGGTSGTAAVIAPTVYTTNDLTLAGDISVTGEVAAASLNNAVSLEGVPRRTKVISVSQSGLAVTGSTFTASHTSVSFPVLNGRSYVVQVSGYGYHYGTTSNSPSLNWAAKVQLYYSSASVSQGATSSLGTGLHDIQAGIRYHGTPVSYSIPQYSYFPFHLFGKFTSSEDATYYAHTAHANWVGYANPVVYVQPNMNYMIQEFTSIS